jgi:hypothetical protein
MVQRLHHGQVGVAEVHVLAHDRDPDRIGRRADALHEDLPLGEVRLLVDPEVSRELLVQALVMQRQRHLVDRPSVRRADHAADRDVAQQGDLLLEVPTDRPVAPADDRVGLQTERAQLLHRVLGGLGLQLAGRADERHQGHVDERAAVAADLVPQLADCLEERQGLDVADRSADLDDLHVRLLGLRERADPLLDLVGDVRDHLDRLAQVVAPPLLGQDARVHGAGREVGSTVQILIEEPLVVAEVEIRLRPVVQDEDLSVLEGIHGARVDVDVGVEFLEDDLQPTGLEEAAKGGGGDALAESGGDSARDEDEPRLIHHGKRL